MSNVTATLVSSKDEPEVEIGSGKELEEWLDKLTARSGRDFPHTVRLSVHGYEVEIGLGLEESFVHIDHDSGMPPHFTTVGDSQAEGEVVFYALGGRPTKIPRRNLIAAALARKAVREFFDTGGRLASVAWEKEQ